MPPHQLVKQALVLMPVALRGIGETAPAAVDDAQFFGADAQQRFVEDRAQLAVVTRRGQREGGLASAQGRGDLQLMFEDPRRDQVIGDDQ